MIAMHPVASKPSHDCYLSSLLTELYSTNPGRTRNGLAGGANGNWMNKSESVESDDTFISTSSICISELSALTHSRSDFENKTFFDLTLTIGSLQQHIDEKSVRLLRLLRRRERLRVIINKNCDIITAILQAFSKKRSIDTKMRFSLNPHRNNESSYEQWIRALKSMLRFPDGIPPDFRKDIWLNLADYHIRSRNLDWPALKKMCFNDAPNPDDYDMDAQIIKDLHRTNSIGVPGTSLANEDRIHLKRVLLAFARWNKKIGYCQGLNIIAALILDVMDKNEEKTLKVMIYLIDHVLPPRYYTNNLSGLTVDMSVFRDLLNTRYPNLASQLEKLRHNVAKYDVYEPPLPNLFIMQWFITLFATTFPRDTVLHLWDCLLIRGSEILLRTALVIWQRLTPIVVMAGNPDQFYALMDDVTKRCLEPGTIVAAELIKDIHDVAPFPFKEIEELRDKYTYNISPFSSTTSNKLQQGGESSFKIFDFNLITLIKSLNRKTSKRSPSPLMPKENGNVCDIKTLRAQYKQICQKHKQSLLIISNFPGSQNGSSSNGNMNDNMSNKLSNAQSIEKFKPDRVSVGNLSDNSHKPPQRIIHHEGAGQLLDYDIEPMNHLYLKPGAKAKHKRNIKSIRYSNWN